MRNLDNLEHYLEDTFGAPQVYEGGDEHVYDCPFCEGSRKLCINLKKSVVHCWTCPFGSSLAYFIARWENVPVAQIKAALRGRQLLAFRYKNILKDDEDGDEELIKPTAVDLSWWTDEFQDPLVPKTPMGRKARAYLLGDDRKLTEEQIFSYRIRYAENGRYRGRIMVPVIEKDEVVYFVARDFLGRDPKRKYLNPKNNEVGKTVGQVLFNFERASQHDVVILVEGAFDAMAVGADAMGILGKVVTPSKRKKLQDAGVKRLVVMLDKDVSAKEKRELREGLTGCFEDVRWVHITGDKDPGARSYAQNRELIRKATRMGLQIPGEITFRGSASVLAIVKGGRRDRVW